MLDIILFIVHECGRKIYLCRRSSTVNDDNPESYDDFVRRAALNPIGRRVKLADLEGNSDLSRIANPSQKDYERLAKYKRAIQSIQYN